jgi:hypothetical protein
MQLWDIRAPANSQVSNMTEFPAPIGDLVWVLDEFPLRELRVGTYECESLWPVDRTPAALRGDSMQASRPTRIAVPVADLVRE